MIAVESPADTSRRRLRIGPAEKVLELAEEFVHVLELAIDRREADVRDLVELAEPVHDSRSDFTRGHLALLRVVKLCLDLIHDRVELRGRHGPLLAGLDQSGAEFLPIEVFPAAVLLDD